MPAAVRCNRLTCIVAGRHRTRRRDDHGEPDCKGKHGQTGKCKGAAFRARAANELSIVRFTPIRRLNQKTSQQAAMVPPVQTNVVAVTSTPSPPSIANTAIDTQSLALAAPQSPALAAMGEICIAKTKALIDLANMQGLLEIGDNLFWMASVTRIGDNLLLRDLDYFFLACGFGDLHNMCTDSIADLHNLHVDSIALAFFQIAVALSPVTSTSTNRLRRLEPRAHVRESATILVARILNRIGSGFSLL